MSVKCVMKVIGNKVRLLSKFRDNNEIFSHFEDVFNSFELLVKRNNNNNNFNNNCVKMCRISTECKALDIYEDKCQYNKHFNCFWPKCRFTANNQRDLKEHIDMHLNNSCNQTIG